MCDGANRLGSMGSSMVFIRPAHSGLRSFLLRRRPIRAKNDGHINRMAGRGLQEDLASAQVEDFHEVAGCIRFAAIVNDERLGVILPICIGHLDHIHPLPLEEVRCLAGDSLDPGAVEHGQTGALLLSSHAGWADGNGGGGGSGWGTGGIAWGGGLVWE